MKLSVQCDKCGAIGTAAEITSGYDGIDRCSACDVADRLYDMRTSYRVKLDWLEATHLKDLRELKARINELEGSIP